MTLSDLWQCIKRYWYIVVGLPVACGIVAAIVMLSLPSQEVPVAYRATTRIIANSGIGTVAGYATNEATKLVNEVKEEDPDSTFSISAKGDSATMTVTIAVAGPDREQCNEALETVVSSTLEASRLAFADTYNAENGYTGLPFSATVSEPQFSEVTSEEETGGAFKIIVVAMLAGLLLAICIVVFMQVFRRSVLGIRNIEEAVELPVLSRHPGAMEGERLLANIRFATGNDELQSICIVPVGSFDAAKEICRCLQKEIEREDLSVTQLSQEEAVRADGLARKDNSIVLVCCNALNESMTPAYASQKTDATIIVVEKWVDSITHLQETASELKLAGAALAGSAFIEKPL